MLIMREEYNSLYSCRSQSFCGVCVCERERETETETDRQTDGWMETKTGCYIDQ